MKKRPLSFWIVSSVWFGMIAWMPLQIAYLYGHSWTEIVQIFQKISLSNAITIFTLAIVAGHAWNGSRWLYMSLPLSVFVVGYNNHLVGSWAYDYSLIQAHLATLSYLGLCGFIFFPAYAEVLQSPHLRWWLVAPRVPLQRPVQVAPFRGRSYHSYTVDLSTTGALLEFSQGIPPDLGENLNLAVKLDPIQSLNIKAQVVREVHSTNHVGVHFTSIEPHQRNLLQRYLQIH